MKRIFTHPRSSRRRAVIAVQVMVFAVVVLGFAALTIDVGVMYNTRADLQRAADAAALAGASALTSDTMMQVRMGAGGSEVFAEVIGSAYTRADVLSALNPSFGTTATSIQPGDIASGWLDLESATATVQTGVPPDQCNAVRVVVRRDEKGSNGPVTFLFAPVFGRLTGKTGASATAVFDDRVGGFDTSTLPGGLLPFTIHEDMFDDYFVNGDDGYRWDEDTENVIPSGDGVPEINLYPHDMVPGNFGLLNVGTPNMGTPALQDHIENGVQPEDFEAEVGSPVLVFFDEDGSAVTYDITGTPGLVATLVSSIETRVGQVVGFFLHNVVVDTGSNSIYTITNLRFGRLMDIRLTGGPMHQGLWIQPVTYVGADVRLSRNAPSSGGLLGRLVIAR